MDTPAVRAENLTKAYPLRLGFARRPAIAGCSFEARSGDVVGVLGPNGSGKSTLLRCIAGLEAPDSGGAWLHGAPSGSKDAFRRLGYCPEGSPFPASARARDCLLDLGRLSGLRGAALVQGVDAALDRFGLAAEARTRTGRLSRGQQRRLSLAQAFLRDPDVVLLDEPTSGLDALGIVTLVEIVKEASARGRTILLSTHVLSDVDALCSRVLLLQRGRLASSGTVDEVLGDPTRVEMVLEGAGEEALASMERAARAAGARVLASRPARRPLTEIFGETKR